MKEGNSFLSRTELMLGAEAMKRLASARVCVIGLGGVGGSCAEALLRAGVGHLILMDHDKVDITNLNRQLFATLKTLGQKKADAAVSRLSSINPEAELISLPLFYEESSMEEVFSLAPEYIIDAFDTVSGKLHLAKECHSRGIPLIMCMGTGNRMNPTAFRLGKIKETAGCGCGLSRVMRKELRRLDLTEQMVLYSTEEPKKLVASSENGRHSPASISFCPPVAGYIIASHVIRYFAE